MDAVWAADGVARGPDEQLADEELQRFVKDTVRDVVQHVQTSMQLPGASPRVSSGGAAPSRNGATGHRTSTPPAHTDASPQERYAPRQTTSQGTPRTAPSSVRGAAPSRGEDKGQRVSSAGGERRAGKSGPSELHEVDADFPIVPGSSCADALDIPGQLDASIRLHKAQIRALERDVETVRGELAESRRDCKSAQEELRALKAERTAAGQSARATENSVIKLQKQVDELKGQLAARDAALREVSDEANARDRAKRAAEGDLKTRNARLNRALEEVQRYRKLLEEAKAKETAERSVAQSDHNRVINENRKLERQKAELLAAFRKQMKLIDVLKRQKVHIEAARMLQFSEDEFLRALEMPATTF